MRSTASTHRRLARHSISIESPTPHNINNSYFAQGNWQEHLQSCHHVKRFDVKLAYSSLIVIRSEEDWEGTQMGKEKRYGFCNGLKNIE